MASTEGLVPITRSFLARYYDKYEFVPLHDDVQRLSTELREGSRILMDEAQPIPAEESVLQEANSVPPHKMDHNLWKNREHIEETLHLLETFNWPKKLQRQETPEEVDVVLIIEKVKTKLEEALKFLESFQAKNADHIFQVVMTYMPQDFRGVLMRQQRERSERNRQAEVESLINSGGSIHDRYALLWKQQMERRRQLAQLGSATGVYKTLVKYLVGVPQVLLDFIRQINDDQGPMEEQRQRFGPPLYSLTSMVVWVRLFLLLLWGRLEAGNLYKEKFDVLEQAVNVYVSELERFLKFIGEVFQNSPFFISADDACAAESRMNDDFKETMIPAGKTHEILLSVDSVNSYIAWDFSLVQGKINLMILPYRRCESDQVNINLSFPALNWFGIREYNLGDHYRREISVRALLGHTDSSGTILTQTSSRRCCDIKSTLYHLWRKQQGLKVKQMFPWSRPEPSVGIGRFLPAEQILLRGPFVPHLDSSSGLSFLLPFLISSWAHLLAAEGYH